MATVNVYKGKRKTSYQLTLYKGYMTDTNGKQKQIKETVTYTLEEMGISAVSDKGNPRSEGTILKEVQLYADNLEKSSVGKNYTRGDKIKFCDFYENKWKVWAKDHYSESSYYVYCKCIEKIAMPEIGMLKLSKITNERLTEFYFRLGRAEKKLGGNESKGGYTKNSLLGINRNISSVMELAVKYKVLEENPCKHVDFPNTSANEHEKAMCFTKEQTERFLEALENPPAHIREAFYKETNQTITRVYDFCHRELTKLHYDTYKMLFRLAIYSGCRVGELCALTWNDIDSENDVINITKSLAYASGKQYIKEPKNQFSIREVVIPHAEIERLMELRKKQKESIMRLGTAWRGYTDRKDLDKNLVFSSFDGDYLWKSHINRVLERVIKNYNEHVQENMRLPVLSIHRLRHTSATLLIASEMDVKTISARLGHSNTTTTLNIYAHPLKEKDKEASAVLENMLTMKNA